MEKLLIIGGSGYLGRRLTRMAQGRGIATRASYYRRPEHCPEHGVALDLVGDDLDARLAELEADTIIHTAAINPGAGSEEAMWALNARGTGRLARAAARAGCRRFVYLSTDVVHDGTAGPYGDDAPSTATSAYGRSKAAGEEEALEALPGVAVVVRTSLIYGLDVIDRGTKGFSDRLAGGLPVRLFTDVLRQPIWNVSLAEALLYLAEEESFAGRINVAGQQVSSRAAFGRRLLAHWGFEWDPEQLLDVEARALAPGVPRDLRLDLEKARAILPIGLPGVDEVLGAQQVARSTRAQSEQT